MEAIRRHADITITPLDSPTQIKIRDNPRFVVYKFILAH
jgi:hypothetical protein